MIFINNRYTAIYYKIINSAKENHISNDAERHHIIPKSFFKNRYRIGPSGWLDGNPNDPNNIVFLSQREHAFCHKLLVRMTQGKMKSKMVLAIWRMMNGKHKKLFSSKDYQNYRALFTENIKNINLGKKRKPLAESHRENISLATKGISKTEKAKNNMKIGWENRDRNVKESTRELNRIASTNFWSSSEVRKSQSEKRKEFLRLNPLFLEEQLKRLKKYNTCEYCGISTNIGNYKRWHGTKCRLNNI